MGKMLYLECAAGISGDMVVAALLDLGASEQKLQEALASLSVQGFETRISRVSKAGLDACDFAVVLDAAHENHDHDMNYLHGVHDDAPCDTKGQHVHDCEKHHHDPSHHHHEHRGMSDIEAIINGAAITTRAKKIALRIFTIIAEAEAKAHAVPASQVHFHEVGAVDSIVDVVAFSVCFDDLGLDDVVVERLCEGRGTVRCQHGVLPVPVPAVANIVSAAGIPLSLMDVQGEFVTPTGAAIAAAVRTHKALPPRFEIKRVGLGAGKREYSVPSLLRAMIIEEVEDSASAPECIKNASASERSGESFIWRLECEVDDCSGEALGFVMGKLFAAGAREAHFVPVFMKKNRPAYQIQVICTKDMIPAMEAELFTHTTTIGIRRIPMERTALPREVIQVETPLGSVRAKRATLPNGKQRIYPEHDDVVALCESSEQLAYQDAYRLVLSAIERDNQSE